MANRLADETSPYLLQHADNPVDWWPWSDAAFAEARRRGVPVLLSVGYASCHWCHVMAHESFEDEDTADYLNEHFVSVKVDREERPDVDAVYMEAVQAATGQGGWPMTVFLTPDAEPFYFGTYFPPDPAHGMPSFRQVLEGVAHGVDRPARRGRRGRRADRAGPGRRAASRYGAAAAARRRRSWPPALLGLTRDFDAVHGGFGGAPKFPPSMALEFLLRHHARTGSEGALEMVAGDLRGDGARRHLRPARRRLRALLRGRATGSCRTSRRCSTTTRCCAASTPTCGAPPAPSSRAGSPWRPPTSWCANCAPHEGGFASALDADSDDGTGAHRRGRLLRVDARAADARCSASRTAEWAADYFGVTEEGTFEEGASVLQLPTARRPVRRRPRRPPYGSGCCAHASERPAPRP